MIMASVRTALVPNSRPTAKRSVHVTLLCITTVLRFTHTACPIIKIVTRAVEQRTPIGPLPAFKPNSIDEPALFHRPTFQPADVKLAAGYRLVRRHSSHNSSRLVNAMRCANFCFQIVPRDGLKTAPMARWNLQSTSLTKGTFSLSQTLS